MAYRDDLEAAHARIEALEQQLASTDLDADSARTLLDRSRALEQQLSEMQERVRTVVTSHERLAEALRTASGDLPTLTEYNRSIAPRKHALSGEPAGVRCPLCAILGDAVEMRSGGNVQMVVHLESVMIPAGGTVRCPRCSHLALKMVR